MRHVVGVLEIERDGLFVAVDGKKVSAEVAEEGRAPPAGLVAAPGFFDLDDARAFVAEELGAEGAGEDAGEVGDENAVQREVHK